MVFYFYVKWTLIDAYEPKNMTSKKRLFDDRYYLLSSRGLTHGSFWVLYYVFFSFLWAVDGNYYQSFGLELILMPIRILASYTVIYFLIPRYLSKDKELQFVAAYLAVVIIGGLLQRVLVYYYYELLFNKSPSSLFDLTQTVRAIVLINSTVMFITALKILQLWKLERNAKEGKEEAILIRADKRNYRVYPRDIYYVEGMGNYVTFYLTKDKRLISYKSMKDVEKILPDHFERIHKSFIINKNHVDSYSSENVEIANRMLPIGKSVSFSL